MTPHQLLVEEIGYKLGQLAADESVPAEQTIHELEEAGLVIADLISMVEQRGAEPCAG